MSTPKYNEIWGIQIENKPQHGLLNVIGHDMLHVYDRHYNTFLKLELIK